mgnify:CR=1 FL=1
MPFWEQLMQNTTIGTNIRMNHKGIREQLRILFCAIIYNIYVDFGIKSVIILLGNKLDLITRDENNNFFILNLNYLIFSSLYPS